MLSFHNLTLVKYSFWSTEVQTFQKDLANIIIGMMLKSEYKRQEKQ